MIDSLACLLVKSLGGILCRLPPGFSVWLGARGGDLAYVVQSRRAHLGYLNLKAAFGNRLSPWEARRIVRACFRQLGAGVVELFRLPVLDAAYVDRYIAIEGREHIDRAVASGRPVLLLTAHFGNWELSAIAAALKGYPIVALARAQDRLPKLYRLLVSYRESKGCRIIHKGGVMKRLITALKERQLVGIAGDQASRQGIFVEFFGRPALFSTGPFELARMSRAIIIPGFIYRVRGPYHRLVVEEPIELPRAKDPATAIRKAIESFARLLAKHIERDPTQWLWMHRRWKHTPARRVLILSDGRLGHVKQSLTVLEAIKEHLPTVQEQTAEVRYRHRLGRALALVWSWMPGGIGGLRVLSLVLTPASFRAAGWTYADIIISCGSSLAPVNALLAADNRAKAVVVMDPTPVPLRKFTLAFIPLHDDAATRPNVVRTVGALNHIRDDELHTARARLLAHPNFRHAGKPPSDEPVIGVFVGGNTPDYQFTVGFTETMVNQVLTACDEVDGWCAVTTSRRTPSDVERWLATRLGHHPRCRLLLLASRDTLDGTVEGILGFAHLVIVTGESISMVSEAAASGRHVIVVEPPLRNLSASGWIKQQRFIRALAEERYVRLLAIPELSHAIRRILKEKPAVRRLETYTAVQEAVKRLL